MNDETKKEFKSFEDFTNLYALSKTLRFELRVPEDFCGTQVMLDQECVFEKDRIRREKYEEARPWINRLHREFIRDAFLNCDDHGFSAHEKFAFGYEDLSSYHKAIEDWKNDKKSKDTKKKLMQVEIGLRQKIVHQFDVCAKSWVARYPDLKSKKIDVGVLFKAGVFRVMAQKYKDEEGVVIDIEGKKTNIFDGWKGWAGYFKKFFQTRENFYSAGDESTAVAYRIVNQNLKRFCDNLASFEKIKDKLDIKKIESDLGVSCDDVFSLQYYNVCFLQEGIDAYNRVLGGYVGENDEKVHGINQAINEYRQRNKGDKIKFLAMLDKQIHSEKDKFIDEIEDDVQLLENLKKFVKVADYKLQAFRLLIEHFTEHLSDYGNELNKIYMSSEAFERNAGRWFADYASFERALITIGKTKGWKDAYSILGQKAPTEKDGGIKYPDFLVLGHIAQALELVGVSVFKEKYSEQIQNFLSLTSINAFVEVLRYEVAYQFAHFEADKNQTGYDVFKQQVDQIIASKPESINTDVKIAIKRYADTALVIYQIAKYFAVEKKRGWLENYELSDLFYSETNRGYLTMFYEATDSHADAYTEIVKGYNALRNYLTRKPYSTDKWLLNFDIQTLADGWDKNKEKANGAIILRKEEQYYLGIMHRDHMDLFTEKYAPMYSGVGFEKMEYKYFPEASKMIPKCSTQLQNVHQHFEGSDADFVLFKKGDFTKEVILSRRVYDLNNVLFRKDNVAVSFAPKNDEQKKEGVKQFQKEYLELSKNEFLYRAALKDWIEFCVLFLKAYNSTSIFDFTNLKKAREYNSLDEFYRDINALTYSHVFVSLSEDYVRERNNSCELFLFEIHNKDWNLKDGKKKTGTKNLHTMYWEQLFSDENQKEKFLFKLNGEAELFFRPKTDESKLGTKFISGEKRVNHWRYAHDKIFFHCPITLNRVSEDKTEYEMNANVRALIAKKQVNIIGIDRGEKNLAYYYVIDQDGNRKAQGSLNSLGETNGKTVAYAEILEKRAKDREEARREWQDIEQIKDTKRGFVSQMVRKITDLAIEHNAIIVLEDLNMRFKQVRGGIEKSIYQRFEKQLIDKLSFVVDKNEIEPIKAGHPLRALQLAYPISAFKDMGKQTGIVFYTAASYTSRTCPICGYHRNVRFQFEDKKQAVGLLKSLDGFSFNEEEDTFNISYSLDKMLTKEQLGGSKAKNKLYEDKKRKDTFVLTTKDAIRYKWIPKESPRLRALSDSMGVEICEEEGTDEQATRRGVTKKFDLTAYIKAALSKANITFTTGDFKSAICHEDRNVEFFQKIFFALFLLTETRQTISGKDVDYIHCPECGFDSRKGFQGKEFNGDANGAYNIARKGLMVTKKIRQYAKDADVEKMGWGELAVGLEEWDKFTQRDNAK